MKSQVDRGSPVVLTSALYEMQSYSIMGADVLGRASCQWGRGRTSATGGVVSPQIACSERMMVCKASSRRGPDQAGRQQVLIIDVLSQAAVARSTDDGQLWRKESLSGKMVPLEERPRKEGRKSQGALKRRLCDSRAQGIQG